MYAVIETCGRQYKVEKGDVVFFEKLDVEEGKKVTFDKVMLLSDDGKVTVGTPYVSVATVEGKVVGNGRGKKIRVFKYKAKANERKTIGHRQDYTKVEITAVGSKASSAKTESKAEKPAEKKVEAKTTEAKVEKKAEVKAEAKTEKKTETKTTKKAETK